MKFLTIKQIYLDLGISYELLYYRIAAGYYPPLERHGHKIHNKGYFENTFNAIKDIAIRKVGRPKKYL